MWTRLTAQSQADRSGRRKCIVPWWGLSAPRNQNTGMVTIAPPRAAQIGLSVIVRIASCVPREITKAAMMRAAARRANRHVDRATPLMAGEAETLPAVSFLH